MFALVSSFDCYLFGLFLLCFHSFICRAPWHLFGLSFSYRLLKFALKGVTERVG